MRELRTNASSVWLCLVIIFFFLSCRKEQDSIKKIQIAFLADVHFQDIYADFTNTDYRGVYNQETGKYNTIRTMGAQLQSTRLFNENYFALYAALNEIVAENIKLVVLPGDFSDDGQPMNIKALRAILHEYEVAHGIQFLLTTGNHDPVRPFAIEGGKYDFLGKDGGRQSVLSDSSLVKSIDLNENTPVITKSLQRWGYKDITAELADFGFYPRKEYSYWETPFSSYTFKTYDFYQAQQDAVLQKRMYETDSSSISLPDMSYLVEPIHDVWFLAIDANVYIPKPNTSRNSLQASDFSGASIGYNNVLTHKKHLIDWVKKVAFEAQENDKTLIAFSHYPLVDFTDGTAKEFKTFFGSDKMQSYRIPEDEVAEIFANAGIQLHFGGHMHMNDTGVYTSKKGNTLFNIQVPSLAGYIPAYKVLTLNSTNKVQIETKIVADMSDFNSLFSLYEREYQYLKSQQKTEIWNKEILNSKTYLEFSKSHFKELVLNRLVPADWPGDFLEQIALKRGSTLLFHNQTVDSVAIEESLAEVNLKSDDFKKWTGLDMIFDFHQIYIADELGKAEISKDRLSQYLFLCEQWKNSNIKKFRLWSKIFSKSLKGQPSDRFEIDLNSSVIRRIETEKTTEKVTDKL